MVRADDGKLGWHTDVVALTSGIERLHRHAFLLEGEGFLEVLRCGASGRTSGLPRLARLHLEAGGSYRLPPYFKKMGRGNDQEGWVLHAGRATSPRLTLFLDADEELHSHTALALL